MTLAAQIVSDIDLFFDPDEVATEITYKALGTGAGVSIDAILDVGGESQGIGSTPNPKDGMMIAVKAADVSAPNYKDTFTISGDTWYLRNVIEGGPHTGALKLEVSKSSRRQI